MVLKQVTQYGFWESPINVDTVDGKSRSLFSPRTDPASGRAFFTESTEDGRNTIMEVLSDGSVKEVLPAPHSAENTVYEYGGAPYGTAGPARILFSAKDGSVKLLNLDGDAPSVSDIVGAPYLRYSDFDSHPTLPWAVAVQEDHKHNTPSQVRNYVVAINYERKVTKRIVDGADFYYTPQLSPDGTRLAWLEWDHPELPFADAKLYVAECEYGQEDVTIKHKIHVAGGKSLGVGEPRWAEDGTLFFAKEVGDYRRPFILRGLEVMPIPLDIENAEFGEISLLPTSRTYALLTPKRIVAALVRRSVSTLTLIDVNTGSCTALPWPIKDIKFDSMARLSETSFLVVGAQIKAAKAVYKITIGSEPGIFTIRESLDQAIDPRYFSEPEVVEFPSQSTPRRTIYSLLWKPANPRFTAPEGTLPPLIVNPHGGPTSYTGPGLALATQYYTSRGYAVLALNYTGSSGHGRAYRDALWGAWGIVDAADAAECAAYLAARGAVDGARVGISGGSAGGYNVLQALTRHPGAFAAGNCVCGVSDLAGLAAATHKLESRYVDALVLPAGGEAPGEEERERIYRERSALHHAGDIDAPLLLVHGSEDPVVPVAQAKMMYDLLVKKGREAKLVVIQGEGHMFGKPGSRAIWLREEEAWWRKHLLKDVSDA